GPGAEEGAARGAALVLRAAVPAGLDTRGTDPLRKPGVESTRVDGCAVRPPITSTRACRPRSPPASRRHAGHPPPHTRAHRPQDGGRDRARRDPAPPAAPIGAYRFRPRP